MTYKDLAAIWIVSGKQYAAEAELSAASVAHHMPQVARYLFTPDEDIYAVHFDQVEILPPRSYPHNWFLDSVRYTGYAMEHISQNRIVCLHSDTLALGQFGDVYSMLWSFDMLGVQANTFSGKTHWGIPDAFAEIETGFIGWRKTGTTLEFVRDWWKLFETNETDYGSNDRPGLREALWQYARYNTSFRYYVLPERYLRQDIKYPAGEPTLRRVGNLMTLADTVIVHGRPLTENIS